MGNSGNGKSMMALLFEQRGEVIKVTEDVLLPAAGKEKNDKRVTKLLLEQREVSVSEEVLVAAAGEPGNGKKVLAGSRSMICCSWSQLVGLLSVVGSTALRP